MIFSARSRKEAGCHTSIPPVMNVGADLLTFDSVSLGRLVLSFTITAVLEKTKTSHSFKMNSRLTQINWEPTDAETLSNRKTRFDCSEEMKN